MIKEPDGQRSESPHAVVQVADREYLGERGYLPSTSALRIRPAKRGSGQDDVSVSHNQYLSSSTRFCWRPTR